MQGLCEVGHKADARTFDDRGQLMQTGRARVVAELRRRLQANDFGCVLAQ